MSGTEISVTVISQTRRPAATRTPVKPKYSEFSHDIKAHQNNCSTCHKFPTSNWEKVRPADEAFPDITDYPKHESCLNCHRQQFFRGAQPAICTVCHTNPSPRDSTRHPFPNPREIFDVSEKGKTATTDFDINFPHDKHIEIVSSSGAAKGAFRYASFGRRRQNEESCKFCHTMLQPQGDSDVEFVTTPPKDLGDAFWLKKGTFKSVPIGHSSCFTCHSVDSGLSPAPTDCAVCHKLKAAEPIADFSAALATKVGINDRVTLDLWRRRDSSGAFRHEFASHADLSCSTCHNVETMVTTDAATKRVGIASCSMCHVTATEDDGGVLNYEVGARRKDQAFRCSKCHVEFGAKPIPPSHLKAIVDAGGKP